MEDVVAPESIALSARALVVRWADGEVALPAAALRARCRCASCQAVRLRGQVVEAGEDIRLIDARAVGRYALQLVFSDGHERGIFPWAQLRAMMDSIAG